MSFTRESPELAPRNALHHKGWGRQNGYGATYYCNPPPGTPMIRASIFYQTHYISAVQAKTLLRKRILLGMSYKGIMYLCINPVFEEMDFAEVMAWGGS